jgi:signal peptidase I
MGTRSEESLCGHLRAATSSSRGADSRSLMRTIWKSWIKPVGMAVFLVMTFRSAVADWNDVPSQSMEPTILVGDRIFVNKLAYDLKLPFTTWKLAQWGDPERGDIVIFFAPVSGKRMVKRVVGVPGDTVEMRDNEVFINDQSLSYQPLKESYFDTTDLTDPAPYSFSVEALGPHSHTMMVQPMRYATRDFGPVRVPAGQYFVMGDNRDNSGDSRVFGFVPRSEIVGKAIGLAFSLDQEKSYTPRWQRFFRGLQ